MLSEAYDLMRALEGAEIPLPLVHPRIKGPVAGGKERLRVRLNGDGNVSGLEAMTDDEWLGTWAMMRTSDASFPVLRIKEPLLGLPAEHELWPKLAAARSANDVRALLRVLREAMESSPTYANLQKTLDEIRTLRSSKARELASVYDEEKRYLCVREVAVRFLKGTETPQVFLESIADAVLQNVEHGLGVDVDTAVHLILGKKPRPGAKADNIQVQLALDLPAGGQPQLYSVRTREYVIASLPASPKKPKRQTAAACEQRQCMFSGLTDLETDAFPAAKLPFVGERGISIFSMKSETRANWRYGSSGSALVPVSRSLALRMTGGLHWSVHAGRKGKTWRGVASGQFERKGIEKKDLLIAYVDGKPDIDAAIADFFGSDSGSLAKQFEVDSSTVCAALDGVARTQPRSLLRLFVLRQVSPGQVQVVLARAYNPAKVIAAAAEWRAGAANVPPIAVPLPRETGKPPVPYPDEIVRLLSRQWIREGAKRDTSEPYIAVPGPPFGDVLDLMMRQEGIWEPLGHCLLQTTLQRLAPLLRGLFGALRSGDESRRKLYPAKNRETALVAVSALGGALHALGSYKEEYMQESAFAVGKMLALADDIHRSYCEVVRDGSLPPSLLGNSLLSAAMDNPTRAIATLGDRLRVYIGWTKTAKEPGGSDQRSEDARIAIRTARNRFSQYGPFAEEVQRQGLPTRMDDVAKAHLMLGYLASTKGQKEGADDNE